MNRRAVGFTLWELVLVLLLIAVAAALAVPAFVRLGEGDAAQPVGALLALLRDARNAAIDQGATVAVNLDPATAHYRVDTAGPAGAGLLADTTLSLEPGTQLEADSSRARFLFLPTGAAIADSVTVHGGGRTFVVHVDPWSGVARADAR